MEEILRHTAQLVLAGFLNHQQYVKSFAPLLIYSPGVSWLDGLNRP